MVVYHEELCPEISSRGTALDGFHELQKEGETSFSLGAASHFPFASQFQPAKQFPNPGKYGKVATTYFVPTAQLPTHPASMVHIPSDGVTIGW